MKEQENSPEELDEIKTNNLSNKVFRVMTIRILNNWKKDIEPIKEDESDIKCTISEINITREEINHRADEAVDQISNLEDKAGKKHPSRATERKKN